MTRPNLSEFPALVELAASLGADEVVATNLTYAPSPALDRAHVFGEQPLPEDLEILMRAQETARRLNIPLRAYPLQTEPNTLVCDADPLRTVFINHRGDVTPCVYLGLTAQGAIPRYFHGESHPFETTTFGNVRDGMLQVLHGKERQTFIDKFRQRNLSNTPLALFSYMAGQSQEHEIPQPPVPCRFCYKMLGV
jgi:MoaA/NifB/PqqE/SkfB family radical SAM enzyme